MTARVEQYGEFVLGGDEGQDVGLDLVTSALGVMPTKVWRQGEVLRSGRRRRRALWVWTTPEQQTSDSESVLLAVLDQFGPRTEVVHETCRSLNLWAQIGLVISMYGDIETDEQGRAYAGASTPSLAFSVETLERLAAFGVPFDCDQYVIVPSEV